MFTHTALMNQRSGLRKFALQLAGNASDADDLVQSTLLRALEKMHLFQTGTDLFKWTSKIMFNLFVSGYRRKTRFETQYDPEKYIEMKSVEASQEAHMELVKVESSMAQLSPEHREILFMVCIHGMRYEEVSEVLQIPVGTVRSRLSRARQGLENAMNSFSNAPRDMSEAMLPIMNDHMNRMNMPKMSQKQAA